MSGVGGHSRANVTPPATMDVTRNVHRLLAGVQLAGIRLARRRRHLALIATGIAIAAAGLAAVHATSLAAQDRSLARDLARLDPDDRSVRVGWGGIPAQAEAPFPALDRTVRSHLERLRLGAPVAVMLVNETLFSGRTVSLAALDGLERWVRIREGRLPRRCLPTRCEVVQIAGEGRIPRIAGLRLVPVGRGTIRSRLPLADVLARYSSNEALSAAARYHTSGKPPFLLIRGAGELAQVASILDVPRTYTWFVPLPEGAVHPWNADESARDVTRVRTALRSEAQPFDVTAPDETILASVARGDVSARRLLLLGGGAVSLLLAFVVLAASANRRDLEATRRRLRWQGARGWQIGTLEAAEALVVALVGAIGGWAVGQAVAVLAVRQLGAPTVGTLLNSTLSATGLGIVLVLALAAWCVLLASRSTGAYSVGALTVTIADIAALGALAAIGIGLARGAADTAALGDGGTGVFLMLLPGLVTFALAVGWARSVGSSLRLLERVGRGAPFPLRLAALSLARSPGKAAIAVGFLVVSGSLAFFASGYRTMLAHAQSDSAAYAVPRDAVLGADASRLVRVLDAASPVAYDKLGDAAPVIRMSASLPRLSGTRTPTVLGIPADAVDELDGWRGNYSEMSLTEIARRIEPRAELRLRGVELPADARTISLPVRLRGRAVRIGAAIETERGLFEFVSLGIAEAGGRRVLRGRVPPLAQGGRLVGFRFDVARGFRIANAGLGPQPEARGRLTLGDVRVDGTPLRVPYGEWLGVDGIRARASRGEAVLDYFLGPELVSRFRPRQPADGISLPVVVSPNLAEAADDGSLPLDIRGLRVQTHVVGVAERFPSTRGDFVLTDRDTLAAVLNTQSPGAAATNEFWIDARAPGTAHELERALTQTPFDDLDARLQHRVEEAAREDPLASGTLLALVGTTIAALGLALAGVLLVLAADARDEWGELFDLLAQGAPPSSLRSHLRLRILLVAAFGLAGALLGGALLSALAISFVRLSAGAGTPEPPIAFVLDAPVLLGGLALYLALATALVLALSARGIATAGRTGGGAQLS